VTRQRILGDVNKLHCPLLGQSKGRQPSSNNKFEMFFLAKYLLKARLCTIEIKVGRAAQKIVFLCYILSGAHYGFIS
jgi:hypothetical protein